ncbi:hypothetical protein AXG93_977s1340 [Marchantia polymorpha subsp. ruderalis]|uniref:Uncharacterized protein n=1 Tax=Marchantia polymorpha subsp. ruderalis TaxID=1480154 RepID=A0A176WBH5_MARPO|nr:hypothetical protein AXG93_977s1340 [Marchantia polymorpha subsp. ruderalis]
MGPAVKTGESLLAVCLCLDPLQSCFLVRARVGVTLISGVVLLLCAVDRGLDLITGRPIYVSLTTVPAKGSAFGAFGKCSFVEGSSAEGSSAQAKTSAFGSNPCRGAFAEDVRSIQHKRLSHRGNEFVTTYAFGGRFLRPSAFVASAVFVVRFCLRRKAMPSPLRCSFCGRMHLLRSDSPSAERFRRKKKGQRKRQQTIPLPRAPSSLVPSAKEETHSRIFNLAFAQARDAQQENLRRTCGEFVDNALHESVREIGRECVAAESCGELQREIAASSPELPTRSSRVCREFARSSRQQRIGEWLRERNQPPRGYRPHPERWQVSDWKQVLERCAREEDDLLFECESVQVTKEEEISFGALFKNCKSSKNGYKTRDYKDRKRRNVAVALLKILQPHMTTYMTS